MWRLFIIVCAFALFPQTLFAASVTIHITASGFEPSRVEVDRGDVLTFTNDDVAPHWPASNDHPTHTRYPGADIRQCGTENSPVFDACRGLNTKESVKFTLLQPGEWSFHDHLNPALKGSVVVKATPGTRQPSTRDDTLPTLKKLRAWFMQKWYTLFPAKGARSLAALNMLEVTRSDKEIEYWTRIFGPKRLLDELVKDADDPLLHPGASSTAMTLGQCHLRAHFLGHIASKLFGISALGEHAIDTRCQFGFYHGVLEASLGNIGDDETMRAFAANCRRKSNTWLQNIFCEHGIGHVLMVYHDYDLPYVLKKCAELLPNKVGRKMCYQGAYMENIFATIGYGIYAHTTRWVDLKRIDFPCTSDALPNDELVRAACYFTQTLIWSPMAHFNGDAAIAGCMRAPKYARMLCFSGIGFYTVLPNEARSDEQLAETCLKAPTEQYQKACLLNALFARNVFRNGFNGFKNPTLCHALGFDDPNACDAYTRRELSSLFDP